MLASCAYRQYLPVLCLSGACVYVGLLHAIPYRDADVTPCVWHCLAAVDASGMSFSQRLALLQTAD